jgi:hypothetical protein
MDSLAIWFILSTFIVMVSIIAEAWKEHRNTEGS